MKKLFATFAALAILGAAGSALAEEASGTIESVDPTQNQLVLQDGQTFTIGESASVEGLNPGSQVTLSYEEQDGQKVITDVMPKSE
jgi:Cu/Ag efflux protein CusF